MNDHAPFLDEDAFPSSSSYSDVLKHATSSGHLTKDPHKLRLAAVTSALLDVVKEQYGGMDQEKDDKDDSGQANKVYAKAMTALEGTLRQGVTGQGVPTGASLGESFTTQAALLELLVLTIPYVTPTAILVATFPLSSRVLRALVATATAISTSSTDAMKQSMMETSNEELGGMNAVLRWTCKVATVLLQRIGDNPQKTTLDQKALKEFLQGTIFSLVQEQQRPKVRKAAYGSLVELLNHCMGQTSSVYSTTRKLTAQYSRSILTHARKRIKDHPSDPLTDVLHVLPFLEQCLVHLDPVKVGGDIMELFAALSAVDDNSSAANFVAVVKVKDATPKVLALTSILSTIKVLVREEDQRRDSDRSKQIDGFAVRVLASLLQGKPSLLFRPGNAEFDLLQRARLVYGQAVIAACYRVIQSDTSMGHKMLPLSIQMILFLSKPSDEDPDDASVATSLMVELTQLFREQLPALDHGDLTRVDGCLDNTLTALCGVMETFYRPSWSVSLNCLVVLLTFVHRRTTLQKKVKTVVQSLLALRNSVPPGSASQHAVEDSFSSLVQGVGLEVCWNWVDWQSKGSSSSGGIDLQRAWILSKMKTAATVALPNPPRLSFFQAQVLDLARACDKLAAASQADSNFHRMRVLELWSLLPCFCQSPSDIDTSLGPLATTLGRAITDKRYPELVAIICGGISTLASSLSDQRRLGSEDAKTTAMSEAAVHLLPVLFKLVTSRSQSSSGPIKKQNPNGMEVDEAGPEKEGTLDGVQFHAIVKAISQLSSFAPEAFVQNLFKKLMHKLLEELQAESSDAERICSLLGLSQALVAARVLSESNISFLYRALKPLISDDSHGSRVQKWAYKVLVDLCSYYHSYMVDPVRLKELINLLTTTAATSQIAARHMRLKCIMSIVEGFDENQVDGMNDILGITAEIILCVKDSNAKTRESAYQLLTLIATKVGINSFVRTVAAALAAESSTMRSAAVMTFSRLVFEFAWEDQELQSQLPSLLQTVLVLVEEESREVIKSVVGFSRICVAAIPPEQLEPLLPDLIGGLLKYHSTRHRFRSKIKIILKKLVKRFGYDKLMPFVPESETRLLTHMRKLDNRQKRKKEASRMQRPEVDDFDGMICSDEEDSGDGRTLVSGATGLTTRVSSGTANKTVRSRMTSATSKKSRLSSRSSGPDGKATGLRIPTEADGEVVDMLGPKVARRVKFLEDQENNADSSDDEMMEFDDSGKLVIHDEPKVDVHNMAAVNDDFQGRLKRRRLDAGSRNSKTSQSRRSKQSKQLGSAYKSKKAGGDVKKKNQKFEPYAYVPLDGRSYSKKNRRSAVEQMSSVVRKKGSGGKRKRSS